MYHPVDTEAVNNIYEVFIFRTFRVRYKVSGLAATSADKKVLGMIWK
jgi:hypothetical protein